MTLTVLQSVYRNDRPDYLDAALASLAAQTRPADAVVLVRDGALTPDLDTVIDGWRGRLPLKVVGYAENRGLAFALNYGLRFAETELVARMDSDDIARPERFEKQVCAFEIDGSLRVLGTGIREFYEGADGSRFEKVRLYPKVTRKNSAKLYRGTPLAHPTVMMRTDLLKRFKYDQNTKFSQDIDLWFRLLDAGVELRTLQEPLLDFRITDGTFRRRSVKKALYEFRVYFRSLVRFNGVNGSLAYLFMRLAARFLPPALGRRIYFSEKRGKLFREDFMTVRTFQNCVFQKGGHVFQALLEFEEDGGRRIKARQLDTAIENIVEVAADDVELLSASGGAEVTIPPPMPSSAG